MKITDWKVDGFGALSNLTSPKISSDLVIVHGPNEAGKSTLLEFIRWMLFGQNTRLSERDKARRPVNGGEWGGRVGVASHDEQMQLLRRFGDKKEQLFSLRSAEREWQGDDAAAHLARLLGGADLGLFSGVYALGQSELGKLDVLEDGRVSTHLAMAGVTGAAQSANQSLSALEKSKDALLKSRGTSARLNDLSKQLADADVAVRAAQHVARGYVELVTNEKRFEESLTSLKAQQVQAHEQERRSSLLATVWPTWVELRQLHEMIRAIPDRVLLTETFVTDVEMLGVKSEKVAGEVNNAEANLHSAQSRLAMIQLDELAHAVAADIRALATRQHVIEAHRARVSELHRDQERRTQDIVGRLSTLGQSVTRDQVRARPFTISDEAFVDEVAGRQAELANDAKNIHNDRNTAVRQRMQLGEQIGLAERALKEVDVPTAEDISADQVQIEVLIQRLQGSSVAAPSRVASLARPTASSASRSVWLGMTAAVGVAAGVQLFLGAWIGAVVCAVIAIVGITAAVLAKPAVPSAVSLVQESSEVDRAIAWRVVDLAENASLGQLQQARQRLLEVRQHVERQRDLQTQLDRLVTERAALDNAIDVLDRRMTSTQSSSAELDAAWDEFLSQWGSAISVPVLAARRFSSTVKDVQMLLAQEQSYSAEIYRLTQEISQFDHDVDAATVALDESGSSFAHLLERVEAAQDAHSRHDQEQRVLKDARARLTKATGNAQRCHDQMIEFCAEAGAETAEQLHQWIREQRRRIDLVDQLPRLQNQIDLALGGGEYATVARELLVQGDKLQWELQGEQAAQRLQELDVEIDQMHRQLQEVRQLRQQLETSAAVAERSAERNAIATQLRAAFEDYVCIRASELTIRSTLRQYETERQPAVFTQAGEWFSQVTNGRYQSVLVRDGKPMVRSAEGGEIDPSALSTGTLEQLYLCIRLALASDLSSRSEQLPFVLDDILVNFDQTRAEAVAKLIVSIAKTGQQVLMFTCHERTRDLLQEVQPQAQVIELEQLANR